MEGPGLLPLPLVDWGTAPDLTGAGVKGGGGCGCGPAPVSPAAGPPPLVTAARPRPGLVVVPPCGGRVPPEVRAALPRASWWEPEFSRRPVLDAAALAVRARLAERRDRALAGSSVRTAVEYSVGTPVIVPAACGSSTEVVQLRWDDLSKLGGMDAIDLGYTRWEPAVAWGRLAGAEGIDVAGMGRIVRLATCLPSDEIDPAIDMTLVRELFFPDWERRRDASWSELVACLTVDPAVRVSGLNATAGWGMYSRGVLYALSLLDSFAELGAKPFGASIGYSAEGFRRDLRDGTLSVYLGPALCDESSGFALEALGDGRLRVQGSPQGHGVQFAYSLPNTNCVNDRREQRGVVEKDWPCGPNDSTSHGSVPLSWAIDGGPHDAWPGGNTFVPPDDEDIPGKPEVNP